jgi:hypothetical protein
MSKSKFSRAATFAGAALILALLAPRSAWSACGEVLVSKGDVKIESGADGKSSPAPAGTKVCQGDTVIAGAQSRAKVKMEDGNELNISPESRIKLETYEYKPADNKKKVMLNVLYGKVRAATREENMYNDKATDGQANTFQVKTKSAVAGVRGTDFLTSFDRRTTKTEIVTFRGKVQVGMIGPGGRMMRPVMVGANQRTVALPGSGPAAPKPVTAAEMDKMNTESRTDAKLPGVGEPKSQDSGKEEPKREEPKKDEPKKDVPKKEASNPKGPSGSSGNPGSRAPAAAMPTGSMIDTGDLGSAPGQGPALPVMPNVPLVIPPAVTQLPVVAPVVCDLCNRAVESGPGKVNIRSLVPQ